MRALILKRSKKILSNLLNNAIKYADGNVRIKLLHLVVRILLLISKSEMMATLFQRLIKKKYLIHFIG